VSTCGGQNSSTSSISSHAAEYPWSHETVNVPSKGALCLGPAGQLLQLPPPQSHMPFEHTQIPLSMPPQEQPGHVTVSSPACSDSIMLTGQANKLHQL
jgi:hypothetical protein